MMAFIPEAQALFMVVASVESNKPEVQHVHCVRRTVNILDIVE